MIGDKKIKALEDLNTILKEENKRLRLENALLRKIQAVQDESLDAAMDIKDIALKEIRGRG
jgi:regulator of replication initiation timing